MNIIWYIFYPLTIGIPIFIYAFFKYPRYAIAGLIIAKPIIDVSWNYNIFLSINFLKIYAGLFVILGLIYIIYKRINVLQHPINLIWLIFLVLNVVSIFIISDAHLLLGKINYFLRILTGFIALIMFAHLFDFKKDKKFVLSIFIIAGIFPLLLWLIPVLIGNPILSNDPLRRIIGPYHSFAHFNFYATQTLICCLAYLAFSSRHCEPERSGGVAISTLPVIASVARQSHLFRRSRTFKLMKRVIIYLTILISTAMIYKCYSKAGWITLFAIFLIWFVLQRKFIFASIFVLISVIILFVNPFTKDFQKTFDNEINYFIHGSNTKEMVFRGRLNRWETGMDDFNSLPVINKLFGAKKLIGHPENNYLRILWDNGIIGFIVFLFLLGLTGYLLIRKYVKNKDPVILMGILVFIMFFISGIGSYSMHYPNLQWFMWGTTGFVLSNNKTAVGIKE
jgi:hypothetical protein